MCMMDDWSWSDEMDEELPVRCHNCEYPVPTFGDCLLCQVERWERRAEPAGEVNYENTYGLVKYNGTRETLPAERVSVAVLASGRLLQAKIRLSGPKDIMSNDYWIVDSLYETGIFNLCKGDYWIYLPDEGN